MTRLHKTSFKWHFWLWCILDCSRKKRLQNASPLQWHQNYQVYVYPMAQLLWPTEYHDPIALTICMRGSSFRQKCIKSIYIWKHNLHEIIQIVPFKVSFIQCMNEWTKKTIIIILPVLIGFICWQSTGVFKTRQMEWNTNTVHRLCKATKEPKTIKHPGSNDNLGTFLELFRAEEFPLSRQFNPSPVALVYQISTDYKEQHF